MTDDELIKIDGEYVDINFPKQRDGVRIGRYLVSGLRLNPIVLSAAINQAYREQRRQAIEAERARLYRALPGSHEGKFGDPEELVHEDRGWNACLDRVRQLLKES